MTLAQAFRAYEKNIARGEQARADLLAAMQAAIADGMSQSDLARELGWPRQRVSIWLEPQKKKR